jgi:poly(3-hydroxybutyrate) depolymerase
MLIKVYKNTLMVWTSLLYLASGSTQAELQQGLTLQVIARTFDLYLPDQTGKKPMPLILMFHGNSGDSDAMTGANKRRAPYKVWLRLAMEVPQRFAAVAAVVAAMPKHNGCEQRNTPISVLFMNGTEDPLLPYGGGLVGREKDDRGETASAEESVKYWLSVNHIDSKPEVYEFPDVSKKDRSSVIRYRYANENGGPEVVLYEVRGGGHNEPSRSEHYRRLYKLIVGKQNYDIEMAEEIWGFFQNQHR